MSRTRRRSKLAKGRRSRKNGRSRKQTRRGSRRALMWGGMFDPIKKVVNAVQNYRNEAKNSRDADAFFNQMNQNGPIIPDNKGEAVFNNITTKINGTSDDTELPGLNNHITVDELKIKMRFNSKEIKLFSVTDVTNGRLWILVPPGCTKMSCLKENVKISNYYNKFFYTATHGIDVKSGLMYMNPYRDKDPFGVVKIEYIVPATEPVAATATEPVAATATEPVAATESDVTSDKNAGLPDDDRIYDFNTGVPLMI